MWNEEELFKLGREAYLVKCAKVNAITIEPVYNRSKYNLTIGYIKLHDLNRPLWEGKFSEAGTLITETLF